MIDTTIYIETYGCQMNKLDSETVAAVLAGAGYTLTDDAAEADVILLNTCSVREKAEERIRGRIGQLMQYRRARPNLAIGVLGCMAQRLGGDLLSDVVRVVAGPDAYRRLPELIAQARSGTAADTVLDAAELYDDLRPVRTDPHTAWIAVMRGCDNFCSYCIVPHVRGRERSMPWRLVVEETARLAADGCREVTLLGQNVNSYRDGDVDFAALLDRVAGTGMPWVRFLTSHPKNLTGDIIEVMARRENVCNHLHLPLQSGSDRVLQAMNRGYTVDRYRRLVGEARRGVPGLALTTDLIFGFPGEDEEDFRATLDLMREVRFDFAFLYRYSERSGTSAVHLPGSLPEEVRIARLKEAIALQKGIERERHETLIGTVVRVLVKGRSRTGGGWHGMTDTAVPVVMGGGNPASTGNVCAAGDFVDVLVDGTTGASLTGSIA